MSKRFLAVIPARAGSKRLPGKNSRLLGGKPLIQWTIEAAKNTKYLNEICVSTDSEEIAKIAQDYGVSAPFIRPAELSTDHATTVDVLLHCIKFYKQKFNLVFDYVVLLQPTSPFRDYTDIEEAITLLNKHNADGVISVCKCQHSPLWANVLEDSLALKNFLPKELVKTRSQDLPVYYRLNGAIYICKINELIKQNSLFLEDNIYAYIMSDEKSIDIDTKLDWRWSEFLLNVNKVN